MRRIALALCLIAGVGLTSCYAGPHQLRRTVDDWDQKMYVDSPWLNAVLWVVPVFPVLDFAAGIGDFFVTDAYAFWFKDAWDGKGTAFQHYQVQPASGEDGGTMKSLLMDDGKFLKIETN